MADTKLSGLTELAATPASDDEVYIRDVSEAAEAESKRITVANLEGATTGVHGVGAGAIVGTTLAQALTNKTLTSPTINGTIATTGLTIPAHTLGGLVTLGGQSFSGLATLTHTTAGAYDALTIEDTAAGAAGNRPRIRTLFKDTGGTLREGSFIQFYQAAANGVDDIDVEMRFFVHKGAVNYTTLILNEDMRAIFSKDLELTEMTAPGAGAANTARIYAVVDGGTLTDLAAVFQDGTVDIFAQEVTSLDSPILTENSQIEVKVKMVKPHPGIIQFVAQYPNGKSFVLKEFQYHDAEKIAANKGCESPLPQDWEVTMLQERVDKNVTQLDNQLGRIENQLARLDTEKESNTTRLKQLLELVELGNAELKEREALQDRQMASSAEKEHIQQEKAELEQKKQLELNRLIR